MKFEYENDERDCVAFIDNEGELVVKLEDGTNMVMQENGETFKGVVRFEALFCSAAHKFYRGDKVTITF